MEVAVQKNSFALDYVPESLKTEVLCLEAVQKHGDALEYVIRHIDQLVSDAQQLARWNRILMHVNEIGPVSKKGLQAHLIDPLLAQVNKAAQLPAPVVDEIAILIEHCERLETKVEQIKELYCEKQAFQKPQSKHCLSASSEHTL